MSVFIWIQWKVYLFWWENKRIEIHIAYFAYRMSWWTERPSRLYALRTLLHNFLLLWHYYYSFIIWLTAVHINSPICWMLISALFFSFSALANVCWRWHLIVRLYLLKTSEKNRDNGFLLIWKNLVTNQIKQYANFFFGNL